MTTTNFHLMRRLGLRTVLAALAPLANADVITDWNDRASNLIGEAKVGTPAAIRTMALVQTAVLDAVDEAVLRAIAPSAPVSVDAAVAAANRAILATLLPAQQASLIAAYQAALASINDGPAKDAGIAIGEKAAAALIARRGDDGAATSVAYRPHTSAGAYVPTALPAIPQWSQRRPWLMASAAQFRPAAPPALTSARWTRDYNEVKELGSKLGSRRSTEQTEIARFWEFSLPAIYCGVVRSVADRPGRELERNARLYAMVSQAMDDAMIGVFEAKYHYNFWRPVTAIRNGDLDGNDDTMRDPAWTSLIDAPLHPEYPSGHSILAAAVGTVLKADLGSRRPQTLATSSPTARDAVRRWALVDDFVREVSDARIYAGIHYRSATQAGELMGRQIGKLGRSPAGDLRTVKPSAHTPSTPTNTQVI